MAQSPDGLQPIIKRSLSPHAAVSNAAARSPSFINSPPPTSNSPNLHSPNSSTANLNPAASNTPPSYFSQHHAGSTPMAGVNSSLSSGHQSPNNPPPTPGILLNKHDNNSTSTLKDPHRTQSPPPSDLLRVSSPTSASDSGFSSTSQDGTPNSPPPALGSPVTSYSPTSAMPSHFKPALEAVLTSDLKRSTPSPPSPHCHFAPLPKPEERPQSRRSSIVSGRVKPFIPRPPERSESMSTTAGDNNDEALASGEYTPSLSPTVPGSFFPSHPQSSSSEHFSALSQRLSSSLTFAAPTARHPSSPSRPTSRRSSSSRRSRSPSPPGLFRERDRTNSSTSRTHSPNLSRRPSTDALSLHYIEAGAEGGGGRGVNLSRQNSRAGSERGPSEDVLTMSSPPPSGSGSGIRRPGSTERRSTFDMTKATTSSGGGGGMVDKDKEADLHRLMEKAQHGNVDAERAVSPALHAKEKREREASVGRGRSERESKGSETEVVEVPRVAEGDTEELEEVTEEEEEETIDEEEENEDEEEDNDEENDSQEDEEEEEPDRSRDEDDEDEDDDEEEPAEERKTSKGAAVEVVRWHRDDPQPASSTNETIPEDSLAEQEAEEETILQSQNNSRRPSAIGTPISTD